MKERPILFSAPMVRAILAGTKTQTRRTMKPQPSQSFLPDGAARNYSRTLVDVKTGEQYPDPVVRFGVADDREDCPCKFGRPGDRLWVKETFRVNGTTAGPKITYAADDEERWPAGCPDDCADWIADDNHWRPSIFMRRYASRITLEITDVRAERLNAITEADAVAEGVTAYRSPDLLTVVDSAGNTCQITPDHINGVPKAGDKWTGRTVTHVEPCPGSLLDTAHDSYRKLWDKINGPGSWEANPWVWVITFKHITP